MLLRARVAAASDLGGVLLPWEKAWRVLFFCLLRCDIQGRCDISGQGHGSSTRFEKSGAAGGAELFRGKELAAEARCGSLGRASLLILPPCFLSVCFESIPG